MAKKLVGWVCSSIPNLYLLIFKHANISKCLVIDLVTSPLVAGNSLPRNSIIHSHTYVVIQPKSINPIVKHWGSRQ